jgi:hypothetical protein
MVTIAGALAKAHAKGIDSKVKPRVSAVHLTEISERPSTYFFAVRTLDSGLELSPSLSPRPASSANTARNPSRSSSCGWTSPTPWSLPDRGRRCST